MCKHSVPWQTVKTHKHTQSIESSGCRDKVRWRQMIRCGDFWKKKKKKLFRELCQLSVFTWFYFDAAEFLSAASLLSVSRGTPKRFVPRLLPTGLDLHLQPQPSGPTEWYLTCCSSGRSLLDHVRILSVRGFCVTGPKGPKWDHIRKFSCLYLFCTVTFLILPPQIPLCFTWDSSTQPHLSYLYNKPLRTHLRTPCVLSEHELVTVFLLQLGLHLLPWLC